MHSFGNMPFSTLLASFKLYSVGKVTRTRIQACRDHAQTKRLYVSMKCYAYLGCVGNNIHSRWQKNTSLEVTEDTNYFQFQAENTHICIVLHITSQLLHAISPSTDFKAEQISFTKKHTFISAIVTRTNPSFPLPSCHSHSPLNRKLNFKSAFPFSCTGAQERPWRITV